MINFAKRSAAVSAVAVVGALAVDHEKTNPIKYAVHSQVRVARAHACAQTHGLTGTQARSIDTYTTQPSTTQHSTRTRVPADTAPGGMGFRRHSWGAETITVQGPDRQAGAGARTWHWSVS